VRPRLAAVHGGHALHKKRSWPPFVRVQRLQALDGGIEHLYG
jgi:hypothetical protein